VLDVALDPRAPARPIRWLRGRRGHLARRG
jgi:hypothetical protein